MDATTPRTADRLGLLLCLLALGLHAVGLKDIPFISDEPDLLRVAMASNLGHRLAAHGLLGSFGVVYGPVCVWFYQLALAVTRDLVAVATIKTVVVSAALGLSMGLLARRTGLSPWPLGLLAASPFTAFYQRLMWDNVFLIPLTAGLMAVSGAFLEMPTRSRWMALVAVAAIALNVHVLAVVPLAACAVCMAIFRGGWLREHRGAVAGSALAMVGVNLPLIYGILFDRDPATHPHPALAHAIAGSVKGWLLWSHAGFEHFVPAFYRGSPLLRELQIATGAIAAASGLAALTAVLVACAMRHSPLRAWPTRDKLAVLSALMVLGQILLLGGLRLEPLWHYFNGVWLGYFYLIWWGYDRLQRRAWPRAALAAQTVTVGGMTVLLALHVHDRHGNRTDTYGATLGNQVDVAARIVDRAAAGVTARVDNYRKFPYALETLVYARGLQTGTRLTRTDLRATVRYVSTDPDDGEIEVVFEEAPERTR